jgi:hypothetical protein
MIANFCGLCPLHTDITLCAPNTCNFDVAESALIDGIVTELYTYITDPQSVYDAYLFQYIHLMLYICHLEPLALVPDNQRMCFAREYHTNDASRLQFCNFVPVIRERSRSFAFKSRPSTPKRTYFQCINRALHFLRTQNGTDATVDVLHNLTHTTFMTDTGLSDPLRSGYKPIR